MAAVLVVSLSLSACAPSAGDVHTIARTPSATEAATSPSAGMASGSPPAAPTPPPLPTVAPTFSPAAAATATTVFIAFAGLPPGAYPVHLHSVCNGTQAYHITIVPSLTVGGNGAGGIGIPTTDTGRGWCLIVYTDASLRRVLTARPV
jgi:hypothetical protein